jgi:hypothetical protein
LEESFTEHFGTDENSYTSSAAKLGGSEDFGILGEFELICFSLILGYVCLDARADDLIQRPQLESLRPSGLTGVQTLRYGTRWQQKGVLETCLSTTVPTLHQ